MKYVRLALGVLVGLYALTGLYHAGLTIGHKTGAIAAGGEAVRMIPLMDAMAWWQVVIWVAGLVVFLVAAWRLLRGGKALKPYVVAFVINIGGWLTIQGSDAYAQVFTAAERQIDYYMLAALVGIGAAISWTERDTATAAAVAA